VPTPTAPAPVAPPPPPPVERYDPPVPAANAVVGTGEVSSLSACVRIAWAGHELVARQAIGIEDREVRRLVQWSHVGEHQPMILLHGIGAVIEAILQRAVPRLARGIEDLPIHVKESAVIAALNPLLTDQVELQQCPAMGTVQL